MGFKDLFKKKSNADGEEIKEEKKSKKEQKPKKEKKNKKEKRSKQLDNETEVAVEKAPDWTEIFKNIYMKNNIFVPLAQTTEVIGLSGEFDSKIRTNDVLIVNDAHQKMIDNLIIPMISKANLSYVIYDPSGDIYGQTEELLRKNNYDIRVVNFCDSAVGSTDRIDFFEMLNIHHKTEELAKIIANCFDTDLMQRISFVLLVAVFEFIIQMGSDVTSTRVRWVFDQIKKNNKDVIMAIEKTPKSGAALRHHIDGMTRGNIIKVIDKLDKDIIPVMEKFGVNPSIYSVLMAHRNVAIYVKGISEESNYIATAMIYNLMSLSACIGTEDERALNTIIFDTTSDDWYNREEINRWRRNSFDANGECISVVHIRDTMVELTQSPFRPALTLFVGSTNAETLDASYDMIRKAYIIANKLEDKEDTQIEIKKEELEMLGQDVIIFANTDNPDLMFSPMRCKLLNI